jgi:hypothetical protein
MAAYWPDGNAPGDCTKGEHLMDDDDTDVVVEQVRSTIAATNALTAEMQEITTKLESIRDRFLRKEISKEEAVREKAALQPRIKELNARGAAQKKDMAAGHVTLSLEGSRLVLKEDLSLVTRKQNLSGPAPKLYRAAEITNDAEKALPDVFRKFYPRRYENIVSYHSPKQVAGALTQMVGELHYLGLTQLGTAMKLMLPAMDYMVERRMPMFFVAPKLLEAVKRSDFQDEIDWVNLKLPYEHGCFVMPKGGFPHHSDGECICIWWSRVQPGEYTVKAADAKNKIAITTNALGIVAFTEHGVFYDSNLTDAIRPMVKMRNLFYKYGDKVPDSSSGAMDEPLRAEDEPFIEQMGAIVFGLFLAMNARAGLVTAGSRLKLVKGKPGQSNVEYWTPNVIGKNYETKKVLGAGTHASPRMHWRRGCYRHQHFGVGNTEVKVIWIEPCLVAAGAKAEPV